LFWTGISLILNFSKGAYHPGIDVGMELCAWGIVAGTIWYLILWIWSVGYYGTVLCSAEGCTLVKAALLLASEIIAAVSIGVCG
jgi:hypothetical protein